MMMLTMAGAFCAPAIAVADDLDEAMQAFGVQMPREHKPAPDFSLPGFDGGTVHLSELRGQLVLLHFWATWCVPCRHEMPLLHGMEKKLKGKSFRIVCVNVDRGGEQDVQDFMQEVSPGFHTLLDPEGGVRNRYEVRALPTSYLIGGDGKIIGRIIGEREWNSEASLHLFRQLLAEYASL